MAKSEEKQKPQKCTEITACKLRSTLHKSLKINALSNKLSLLALRRNNVNDCHYCIDNPEVRIVFEFVSVFVIIKFLMAF